MRKETLKVIPSFKEPVSLVNKGSELETEEEVYEITMDNIDDELKDIDIGLSNLLQRYKRSRDFSGNETQKLLVAEQEPILIDTRYTINNFIGLPGLQVLKSYYTFAIAYMIANILGLLAILGAVPDVFCVVSFFIMILFLCLVIIFNFNLHIAKVLIYRFEAAYLFVSFTTIAICMIIIYRSMKMPYLPFYIFSCYSSWLCMILADSLPLKLKQRFMTGNGILFCIVFGVILYGLMFDWYPDIHYSFYNRTVSTISICTSSIIHNYIFTLKNIYMLSVNNRLLPTFQIRKKYIKLSKQKADILIMASKFF